MAVTFRTGSGGTGSGGAGADGGGAGAPPSIGICICIVLLLMIGAGPAVLAAEGPAPMAIPVSVEAPPDGGPSETPGNEATPAAPQRSNDILRRLQREPLTLFDWGLANLERDLHRASQQLGQEDYATVPPRSSATYRWRDGRIRLSASFFIPAVARTPQGCVVQFRRLVDALVAEAPQGPDAASWYLGSAFQPSGHFWTSRFEDTGAKLLQVVDLRVSLRAPSYDKLAGDTRRIDCSGPLNAAEEALSFEAIS